MKNNILIAHLLFNFVLSAQSFEINELLPDSVYYNQRFGSSVAIFGNVAAVSASNESADGVRSGAVLIFEKDEKEKWEFSTTLRPTDSKRLLGIGAVVALSEEYIFVSARGNSSKKHHGSFVYIFKKEGKNWVETQTLKLESNYKGSYGSSIKVDEDRILVSANAEMISGNEQGVKCQAFIYELNENGLWVVSGEIKNNALESFYKLNQEIELESNHAFVNGSFQDTNEAPVWFCTMTAKDEKGNIIMRKSSPCASKSPMVFVYTESSEGWINTQILKPWDNNGREFGSAISSNGKVLAVSSMYAKNLEDIALAGKVYLYKIDDYGMYQPFQIIYPKDSHYSQGFGSDLELTDNYLIVASESDRLNEDGFHEKDRSGACYVFQKETNGTFIQVQKFVSPRRQKLGNFGRCINVYEDYLIIGSGKRKEKPFRNVMHDEGAAFLVHIKTDAPKTETITENPAIAKISRKADSLEIENRNALLYPNPSLGEFTLTRDSAVVSKVSVIDLNGHSLSEYTYESKSQTFKLPYLPSGVYYIKVESEGNVETMKIVLAH